jgi:hypothetical protein
MEWVVLLGMAFLISLVVFSMRRRTRQRKHDQLDALKRAFERTDPFKGKGERS